VPCGPDSRLGYCLPALNAAARVVMVYTLPVDVVPLASTALLAVLLIVWSSEQGIRSPAPAAA
jgi:hypothetical protein